MHCAICDREDESVTPFNSDCKVCQAIIYDCIESYDDPPETITERECEAAIS